MPKMFNGLSVQSKYDKLKADSLGVTDHVLRVNRCGACSYKDMKYNMNAAQIQSKIRKLNP